MGYLGVFLSTSHEAENLYGYELYYNYKNVLSPNIASITIKEGEVERTFGSGYDNFIDMGNGLRMSLARNKTSANRLDIIYDGGADLYNMRFYRKTFSKKTFESRTKDIETHEGIYCDMLEEMFTMVTGLYTHF